MTKRQRKSGILLPVSSLPGDHGIGDFGAAAYKFIDFLASAEQKLWQILPLGITGYGDSPYQSLSAFAGSPLYIDLNLLVERDYLKAGDIDTQYLSKVQTETDYKAARTIKGAALKLAYQNGFAIEKLFVEDYYSENADWLDDYCAFMIIRQMEGETAWYNWPEQYRNHSRLLVEEIKQSHGEQFWYYVFCQYIFDQQWHMVKCYANDRGIAIIGDIPIYVAADSVDVWANGELFLLDDDKLMIEVAGCPPDAFSDSGQLWGNPVYDWQALADSGYSWWIARLKQVLKYYDSVRIDHFRGFESYWSIPAAAETARDGKWVKGPGIALFDAIKRELGEVDIIAEDLGLLTEAVIALREQCGFPGMKVLQFAFDAAADSLYLPHNLTENSVVYTGTHDNDTVLGWAKTVDRESLQFAIDYLKLDEDEGYAWGFIRAAWRSVCRLAIAPMQDFLNLDGSARINTPATIDGNWLWRVDLAQFSDQLATKIAQLTKCYRR